MAFTRSTRCQYTCVCQLVLQVTFGQECRTRGPQPKGGPQQFRKWPARAPRILMVQVESKINSACMQVIDKNRQKSVEESKIYRTSCAQVLILSRFGAPQSRTHSFLLILFDTLVHFLFSKIGNAPFWLIIFRKKCIPLSID